MKTTKWKQAQVSRMFAVVNSNFPQIPTEFSWLVVLVKADETIPLGASFSGPPPVSLLQTPIRQSLGEYWGSMLYPHPTDHLLVLFYYLFMQAITAQTLVT